MFFLFFNEFKSVLYLYLFFPFLQYHERKYETDVDADLNIDDALLQNGCPSEIQAAQPVLTRESMTSEIDSDRGKYYFGQLHIIGKQSLP